MPGGRESPLTPAASWAPSSGGGRGDGGQVQRSKSSSFARLSRSVSKLGTGKSRRALPGDPDQPQATVSSAPHRRGGSSEAPGASGHSAGAPGPRQVPRTDAGSSGYGGGAGSAAARLRLIEEGRFDLESDLGSLTEKGVETLRADLAQLDGEVSAQLKAAVAAHYTDFTRATPGILRLEGEFQQLRNLLHTMGDVVEGLKDVSAAVSAQAAEQAASLPAGGAHRRGLSTGGLADGRPQPAAEAEAEAAWRVTGDGARWIECLDDTDVAVAERRLSDALSLLRRLEKLLGRFVAGADRGDPAQQVRLDSLSGEVDRRREQLIAMAEHQVLQPTAVPADIRAGADLLSKVAGRRHAHSVVLDAYAAKLKQRQAALLRPASSGGGDADGSDYAAALGQKLALDLSAAADDVAAVFGPPGADAELSAAFLVWALHQTKRACHLLRKHALSPFAAPAGLHAFSRCAFAFSAHCASLEASHGLQLVPTVQRELWPMLEQVLARRVRKLGDSLRRAVAGEVDALAAGNVAPPQDCTSWECLAAAFPSADFLLDELEAVAVEGRRLHSPRLEAALRKAVADLFQLYTSSLAAALNHALKGTAHSEAADRLALAAEGAMELSTMMLERFLAEALAPLAAVAGDLSRSPVMEEHLLRMGEALGMAAVPVASHAAGLAAIEPGGVSHAASSSLAVPAVGSVADSASEAAGTSTEGSEAVRGRTSSE